MAKIKISLLALIALFSLASGWAMAASLPGLGTLSGKVTAPRPLVAAKVIAYNIDKNVKYVVFTYKNEYRVVNAFPGRYRVTIEKPGFSTTEQQIVIRADGSATLDFAMKTAPVADDYVGGMTYPGARILSYDEIYPPGRGREIIERTCQGCHTVQLFPYNVKRTYPMGRNLKDRAAWAITVDRMHKGPAFGQQGAAYFDPALLPPADRDILIDYLATNFGIDSEPRVVRKDIPDPPLDEEALGKAQYIDYIFPNEPGKPDRFTQEIDFHGGDVYIADRGHGLVRLDPRTGEHWDYAGHGGGHGIVVDEVGTIWYSGDVVRRYDPKTGLRDSYVFDGGRVGGGITHKFDANGDLWMAMLTSSKIAKWDRKTDTVRYWDVTPPDRNWGLPRPYGLVLDRQQRVWFGEYHSSGIGMFDPKTETFRHYPLTNLAPTNMRRLGSDSKGWVWMSTWGRPNLKVGGAIYGLDPETGAVKEYPLGLPYSNPYDTQADDEDNIWAATDNYLVRLDRKTGKLTRYPTAVRTDMPKMSISRNGGIWVTSRNAGQSGGYGGNAAVLYPDKDKMTELAAYYSDGNPANFISAYKGPPPPAVTGIIKQSPQGAQNGPNPPRPAAPVNLGPVKPARAEGQLE
jgi:virginiamycin B lyase